MYLPLSAETVIRKNEVIGIFDLDNTSTSRLTVEFLNRAEREGTLTVLTDDIPKALVVCQGKTGQRVYFAQPSSATLLKRAESDSFE